MSIIHDALKKAERERGPQPILVPRPHGGPTARRRLRWGVATGILIAVATLGVSIGPWLRSSGEAPIGRPQTSDQQSSPAVVPAPNDAAARPAVVIQPIAAANPFDPWPRAMSDAMSPSAVSSSVALAPGSVSPEEQAVAETAFERAKDAESGGQWEEAKRHYRQALALNPTLVEAHNNLGNLYIRHQQLIAAIDEFQAALALDPHYAMVRNNLGSAYLLIGEEALAIQEFMAALHIDGDYVSPYYNLASLYARRGEVGPAVAFLTKALALEPAVLSWLDEDSEFDGIRSAAEFQRWRAQGHARR